MLKRYGTEYGGYYYPSDLGLGEDTIVYSIGAGEDISHDCILSSTLNCKVHIFDPTPRAIEHVQHVKRVLEKKEEPIQSKRFGGSDPEYWNYIKAADSNNLFLHNYGLWTCCETKTFYMPENKEYVSCSFVQTAKEQPTLEIPVKDIKTIANELGHPNGPTILKLDIERAECDVLDNLINETPFRPLYIAIDFDLARVNKEGLERVKSTILNMINAGYKLLHNRNYDMTFKYNK